MITNIRFKNVFNGIINLLYITASVGIMTCFVYHSIFQNYTLDIQIYDNYYVIPLSIVWCVLITSYVIHLIYVYTNYVFVNKIILMLQSIAIIALVLVMKIEFGYSYGRRYVSGLTEEQLLRFQEDEWNSFVYTSLIALSTIIISEIITILIVNRRKKYYYKQVNDH